MAWLSTGEAYDVHARWLPALRRVRSWPQVDRGSLKAPGWRGGGADSAREGATRRVACVRRRPTPTRRPAVRMWPPTPSDPRPAGLVVVPSGILLQRVSIGESPTWCTPSAEVWHFVDPVKPAAHEQVRRLASPTQQHL